MAVWIALLGGFSVLVIEILGVHLLAPWFGSSTIIWSQQIAIILLAMAVGAWFGGNVARKQVDLHSKLSKVLAVAAAFFILLAYGVDYFAAKILPTHLSLDQVAGLFQIGSFASAIIFFAPPVFFLSWVTPILVELRVADGSSAGQASGRLGAIATAGSLAGIYFSTFIAIPILGVRASIIAVAILLAIASLMLSKRLRLAIGLPLLGLPLFLESPSLYANMPPSSTLVESLHTPYQKLRVIEFIDPNNGSVERWLQMNEGLDSYQSRWKSTAGELSQWPGGYYDLFALLPTYIEYQQADVKPQHNYCILGYGGGSAVMPIATAEQNHPYKVIGIEIDPVVTELAEKHMPLPRELSANIEVYSDVDARAALRFCDEEQDAIIVDAYSRQFEVPLHMATKEFFDEAYGKLADGGVLCFNLGTTSTELADNVLGYVTASIVASFGSEYVRLQHVARSRNWIIFARKAKQLPPLSDMASLLPSGWPIELGASCLPAECIEGAALKLNPTPALSDDKNSLMANQFFEWARD